MNGNPNNITDAPQHGEIPDKLAFIISVFFLIFATILSNSLVFIAVYAFRGLRTVTNYFVISLASADLCVALLALPVWLTTGLLRLHTDGEVMVFFMSTRWVEVFCAAVSIYGATLVSLDRYLAIDKPLRYREMVTRGRAIKAIAGTWFLSILIAAISFIQYQSTTGMYVWAIFVVVVILCIPLCIMVFSYVCIYQAAVQQLSKMNYNEHNLTSLSAINSKRNADRERRKRFYKELCITKTLGITVSLFFIAWAPFIIIIMVETFHSTKGNYMPEFLERLILYLPYINSFVNPWIYAGINKDFRFALKKLICAPQEFCLCVQKDNLSKRSRASSAVSTGRTLVGSFQGDEQNGSFRSHHSRGLPKHDLKCTSV